MSGTRIPNSRLSRGRRRWRGPGGEGGHLLIGLMTTVTIMAILSGVGYQHWSIIEKREKEAQLIFIQKQYALALLEFQTERGGPPTDPTGNPQVNIGTGTMQRERWAGVIDALIETLSAFDFPGGRLDVRENVRFFGGNHPRWAHAKFPDAACVIAIEFKKSFMDEWTGRPDGVQVEAIGEALQFTAPAVLNALQMPAAGGDTLAVLQIPAGEFEWAPDGLALTYISDQDGFDNIWSQPLDGGEPQQLTFFKTAEEIEYHAWSPNGTRLALTRGVHTGDVVLVRNFR